MKPHRLVPALLFVFVIAFPALGDEPKPGGSLTHFSDYPGYKASNPVVSDDGKFIAFQLATSREAAGVGHGIFVYDLEQAKAGNH